MMAVVLTWTGIVIAATLGIGTTILAVTKKRLKVVKSEVPGDKRRSVALTTLLSMTGVLVVGAATLAAIHTATSSFGSGASEPTATGHFLNPQIMPNYPIPTVPIHLTIYVTAHLQGDVLVIGNATTKNPVVTFESSSPTATNNTWSAYVSFGEKDNGGCFFNLWAVAMPQSLETYLLAEASISKPVTQSYWAASGLPPMPPATVLDHMIVQRNACQPRESCSC
jgi:hypothetical protein